ncbi:hypothetical protein FGG08_002034 [Glutinoglossum americanum]|uniref:GRIP domain-containing protein n=1 Tax=Glutinoglossum americanum TaxID=1670608 RepID=A0A9P8IA34_9PEZI|nr:hypothetical protein FGG08_002034 [Glutinoglossum americanum]
MFQRLKASIDSRIAEEQARQRAAAQEASSSPSRLGSTARRSSSRRTSPSKRQGRSRLPDQGDKDVPAEGPDPSEFEPEFVIGEDDVESRSGTPLPKEKASQVDSDGMGGEAPPVGGGAELKEKPTESRSSNVLSDLPTDVRVKLRKLEKLEPRYQELLRSYRIAHARVVSIEPFETALRENTPLTSISDPSALIEYLNQVNLKGDMVMEELKRVAAERDSFKEKLSEAERGKKDALDEVTKLRMDKADDKPDHPEDLKDASPTTGGEDSVKGSEMDSIGATSSPTPSIKSPVTSILSKALFSPRQKPKDAVESKEESEDLFSYESEVPRLESELRERETEVCRLNAKVETLRSDLAVARESTESIAQSLESATRELQGSRDQSQLQGKGFQEQRAMLEKNADDLKARLQIAQQELEAVKSQANSVQDRQEDGQKFKDKIGTLENEVSDLRAEASQSEKRIQTLNGIVKHLRDQMQEAEAAKSNLQIQVDKKTNAVETLEATVSKLKEPRAADSTSLDLNGHDNSLGAPDASNNTNPKKKNKKKKKGGKAASNTTELAGVPPPEAGEPANTPNDFGAAETTGGKPFSSEGSLKSVAVLEEELASLHILLKDKDSQIGRLQTRAKAEDDLKEEVEGLRDDLINLGQEYVEAKEKIKQLDGEKSVLRESIRELELLVADLRASGASIAESERALENVREEHEDLKLKTTSLQTDLSASQQLAASRFKDLTDIRELFQKAQPELISLRREVADLTVAKKELLGKVTELKKLEDIERQLRQEVSDLKKQVYDQDLQTEKLRERVKLEVSNRSKAEDNARTAQGDFRMVEGEKIEAIDRAEKLSKDLAKSQEDLNIARFKIGGLEREAARLERDIEVLREETLLKTAQHASAQTLMASMRDQAAEMGMQMKEARERCESFEEELADAHRLLSERSREGETMRRLLADVEGRADAKVREMRERMEVAIEERDRAEDEASTIGRKRSREVEELKGKVRDVENNLRRVQEEKEEWEKTENGWQKTRDELRSKAEQSADIVKDYQQAMGELRDALDGSEKQVKDLDKQKSDLQRTTEEMQHRIDKLQRSNKALADELRPIQSAKIKGFGSEAQSSRSSLDSSPSRSDPTPKRKDPALSGSDTPKGRMVNAMDYVYLKNVLLQFLEQKDKKLQQMLIPVLAQLLHFDGKDEQKWTAAIAAR